MTETSRGHRAVLDAAVDHDAVADALTPPVDVIPGEATTSLRRHDGTLEITVKAEGLSSLRAGATSWMSLVAVARDAHEAARTVDSETHRS